MTRYTFAFISSYGGQSDFRIWRDGKDNGRLCIKGNVCSYGDGSKPLIAELDAFNAWQAEQFAEAIAKYGAEYVDSFVPCIGKA